MPHLIEVAFKGNRREFYAWDADEPPKPKQAVIVEADRGEDFGRVHTVGELAAKRCSGCAHGCGTAEPPRKVIRMASGEEERRHDELRTHDDDARRRAMDKVKTHGLVMKVSDAEWQWDRKKLTFYFTAEKRVDFRALVRDLAATFRTRIELKQIGVRDEAKRLSGIGRCGREYCSASWLPELRPVNLQVAKDQRLSLNPSQISGACGRLMCCLRYEHEYYVTARKRFPKEGRTLQTSRGEERVIANDIFSDRVTLRGVDGESRVVPLADLREEMEARAGGAGTAGAEGAGAFATDADDPPESARADRDDAVPDETPSRRPPSRRPPAAREPRTPQASAPPASAPPASMPRASMSQASPPQPPPSATPGTAAPPAPAEPRRDDEEVMRGGYPGARRRGRRGGRRNRPGGEGPRGTTEGE